MCWGGGGSSGDTKIYQQSTSLPGWVDTASKENYDLAKTISDRPYQGYTEPRIAGFNPDQVAAFSGARSAQGQYQPAVNQAVSTATSLANSSWPGANVGAYMDPYVGNVINTTVGEINRQGAIQRQDIERAANNASAWGSDRHGVVEAEQMRNQNDQIARTVAGLYSNAFQNAQGQFNTDRAAQQNAANSLGTLATTGQNLGYTDINALLGIGQTQQAQSQAGLDTSYYDFLTQRDYPIEMLNLRMSALANSPYTTSTMSQTPSTQPNYLSQGLGLFTSGLGALGGFGAFG